MFIYMYRICYGLTTIALGISLFSLRADAETLNPDNINPHADAPRKKITQKQKQAAAEAMKKRKAEIEARKAAEAGQKALEPVQNLQPLSSENGAENAPK